MKKELHIVLSILALVVVGCLFVYYYSRNQMQTTHWVDTKGGDGPYKLRTGSREEEENKIKSYGNSKDIKFKEHPSEHEVIFSTAKGLQSEAKFHKSEKVPEVKY